MAEPYVGEIRLFGGNYAPEGWAMCNGQLLPIVDNEMLFALIGTTYGGDGRSTFAVPDMRGRLPVHMGTNPKTGTNFALAQKGGTETVTLTLNQLPSHSHAAQAQSAAATQVSPENAVWASDALNRFSTATPDTSLNPGAITAAGNPQPVPHDNVMPSLALTYIISLYGIFPSQD